jgi:hypothetical protein
MASGKGMSVKSDVQMNCARKLCSEAFAISKRLSIARHTYPVSASASLCGIQVNMKRRTWLEWGV